MARKTELDWVVSDDDSSDEDNNNLFHETKAVKSNSPLRVDVAAPGNQGVTPANEGHVIYDHGGVGNAPTSFPSRLPPAPPLPPPPPAYFNGNFPHPIMAPPPPQQYYRYYYHNSPGSNNNSNYPSHPQPGNNNNSQTVYQQQQQFPTTTQRHSINAESPLSEFGENELVASTRYVTKWSPSLFKNSNGNAHTAQGNNNISSPSAPPNNFDSPSYRNEMFAANSYGNNNKEVSHLDDAQQPKKYSNSRSPSMESQYLAEIARLKSQVESLSLNAGAHTLAAGSNNGDDMLSAKQQEINQLQSSIQRLQEEEEEKTARHEEEKRKLQLELQDARENIEKLQIAAVGENETASMKNNDMVQQLENTFRKREEDLEISIKEQGVALQKALANEVGFLHHTSCYLNI